MPESHHDQRLENMYSWVGLARGNIHALVAMLGGVCLHHRPGLRVLSPPEIDHRLLTRVNQQDHLQIQGGRDWDRISCSMPDHGGKAQRRCARALPSEDWISACACAGCRVLVHAGLGQGARLTRREWGAVRAALGKPRRLSLAFLKQERAKLESYRNIIRAKYEEVRD